MTSELGLLPKLPHHAKGWTLSLDRSPSGDIILLSRKHVSHLVRDQDCRVDGVGAPNQELQYGFALPSPNHPMTMPDVRSPGRFFRIAS
ncbi:hypothetical protein TNCV_341281 [Trichonephila clavipes]|nr:hypothetical protein TNCV_341281 [Trichonephila clavipes]